MKRSEIGRREFLRASVWSLAGAVSSSSFLGSSVLGCTSTGQNLARRKASAAGFAEFDGLELADLVRRGETTPSELLEWSIARTENLNPSLNAIVLEHFDRARERVARGEIPDGPFRGVPFLLKDLGVELEGTTTTHGSRFFAGPGPLAASSSTLVERYERAGLVIFGKTASPEFGSSSSTESMLFGETQNPWRPGFSPGGSSGGSAAAVASGIVPFAHASDGGGSIRIPASCCGLFGLKPTRGRTPQGPSFFDRSAGLSINHAVTRTVRDSAALLDATQGPSARDPYYAPPVARPYLEEVGRSPGRLRIGLQLVPTLPVSTHADCVEAVQVTARLCESLGHSIEEISPPSMPDDLWRTFGILRGTSIALRVKAREASLGRSVGPDDLEPNNWADYERSNEYSALDFERERQRVYALARKIQAHQAGFDVVLSPTLAIPPPPLGVLDPSTPGEDFAQAATSMAAFTIAYNVSGQPAMNVPLHMSGEGLPIGSMFVAGYGREDLLFRLAGQIEEAAPWRDRWPTIAGVGSAGAGNTIHSGAAA